MKIGITGAAGGIGSVLADVLHNKSIETVLIDDLSSGDITNFEVKDNAKNLKIVNVNDEVKISKILKDCDVIIHLAAISSLASCQINPTLAFHNNFQSTTIIGKLAIRHGIKVIFASTSAVYENSSTFPHHEDDSFQPPTLIYPQSKYYSELFLQGLGTSNLMNYTNLRIFNVFNSRQDFRRKFPPLVTHIIKQVFLKEDLIIYADMNTSRDYISINDLINLFEIFISDTEIGNNETFNVCTGLEISIKNIIVAIEKGLNLSIPVIQGSALNLWEKEEELFDGFHPLEKIQIQKETLKKSIGCPSKLTKHLGFSLETNVLDEIEKNAPYILNSIKNYYH